MEFLVRQTIGGTDAETVDSSISAKRLTLGPAEKDKVLLPGLQSSVSIVARDADSALVVSRSRNLLVDGVLKKRVLLKSGETIEISGLALSLFSPPSGFDLGVLLSGSIDPVDNLAKIMHTAAVPWSMRRMSWFLMCVVVLLCFVVPYYALKETSLEEVAVSAGLPTDMHWSSGPLSSAHLAAGIAEQCDVCHVTPFVMTQDDSCLACHQSLNEHTDVSFHADLGLDKMRCASCQREHNEPSTVIARTDRLCTDCHVNSESWDVKGTSPVMPVTAFAPNQHPEFKVAVLDEAEASAAPIWRRESLLSSEVIDNSGLKFDHQVHLNVDKVVDQDSGGALECGSCHSLTPDRSSFEPVNMEAHCESCHSLAFDPVTPDFELPHASAREVYTVIEGHYLRTFLAATNAESAVDRRRLGSPSEYRTVCTDESYNCAQWESQREARYQFEDTGCVTCHEVNNNHSADIAKRYEVRSVYQTQDWYLYAKFDHQPHEVIDGRTGAEVCGDCHEAATSDSSGDVLMPGIDLCLGCHNANLQTEGAECVSCHWFHPDDGAPSVFARGGRSVGNPNADAWIYKWLE
jgi:predicted CXXCH cytochrome family protein